MVENPLLSGWQIRHNRIPYRLLANERYSMSRFILTIDRPLNDDFPALMAKINKIPGISITKLPPLTTVIIDYNGHSLNRVAFIKRILILLINNTKIDTANSVFGKFTLAEMDSGKVISYDSSKPVLKERLSHH